MTVRSLQVDPITGVPAALLFDDSGKHQLTMFVGFAEATTIAADLAQVTLERPGTHDLMANIVGACGLSVHAVKITDYRRSLFFASVIVRRPGGDLVTVDARPSDALALALRAQAPIRVAMAVVKRCKKLNQRFLQPLCSTAPADVASDFPITMALSSQAANSNADWVGERVERFAQPEDDFVADEPPGGKWKM